VCVEERVRERKRVKRVVTDIIEYIELYAANRSDSFFCSPHGNPYM